jgi:L-asparaginase II
MPTHERRRADLTPPQVPQRPAVVVTRGGIVESAHFIRHAVSDPDGVIIESGGDIDAPTFLRSSAKPLICAAVVASGAADRFGFTDAEIALAAGSHSGEPFHVEAARSMLAKIGLDEGALSCGAHPPIHEPSAEALVRQGLMPGRIHNNCSGKHAAILALAVQLGAPPEGYRLRDHPAQVAILGACAEMFGVPASSMVVGVDGCGIPVVAVPMRTTARFFARLARTAALPERWREPLERVRRAMINNPQYVAGTGRFDTDLMRAAYPQVVCKGGAEGFHASSSIGRGLGMCVKSADGNYRAVSPFVTTRLAALGVLSEEESALLERYVRPPVRNHAGEIVGEIAAI